VTHVNRPIYIIRHLQIEGPGYLAEVLDRHDIPYRIIDLVNGTILPTKLNAVGGLVFLGGPTSMHDNLTWVDQEILLIKRALDNELPILGHGLGAELIASALGASVVRNPVQEIGWFPVHRVQNEASRLWTDGMAKSFYAFKWQRQAFSLPQHAQPLLASQWSTNEAFAVGNVVAFQCHLEMTVNMVHSWLSYFSEQVAQPQDMADDSSMTLNWDAVIQGEDSILLNLEDRIADLHRVADIFYSRWLQGVKEIRGQV